MKQKLGLALLLTLTTALSVLADDGQTNTGNRSIIGYIYDSLGNIVDYLWSC